MQQGPWQSQEGNDAETQAKLPIPLDCKGLLDVLAATKLHHRKGLLADSRKQEPFQIAPTADEPAARSVHAGLIAIMNNLRINRAAHSNSVQNGSRKL